MFYQQPLQLLKTSLWPPSENTYKFWQSVYNIKTYFKQFFTCLERTSTFITSMFRTIYRSSSPDVFSKKDVQLSEVTLLHKCSPVNWLNIRGTPFLKATSGWLLLHIWKWIKTRTRCKLCSSLTIKTPEQRNWCSFGVLIVNFEQISHFVLVLFLSVWNCECRLR